MTNLTLPASLHDELAAAGVPVVTVRHTPALGFDIEYDPAATPEQRATGAAVVTAFDTSEAATAARQLATRRQGAAGLLLGDDSTLAAAVRASDAAIWTHGRNDVAEGVYARLSLLYDALGLTPPTDDAVAARVTTLRAGADPGTPAAVVAAQSRRRLVMEEILGYIGSTIAAGGGDPAAPGG